MDLEIFLEGVRRHQTFLRYNPFSPDAQTANQALKVRNLLAEARGIDKEEAGILLTLMATAGDCGRHLQQILPPIQVDVQLDEIVDKSVLHMAFSLRGEEFSVLLISDDKGIYFLPDGWDEDDEFKRPSPWRAACADELRTYFRQMAEEGFICTKKLGEAYKNLSAS